MYSKELKKLHSVEDSSTYTEQIWISYRAEKANTWHQKSLSVFDVPCN